MKYLLIKIQTQDGEFKHDSVHLHITNGCNVEFAANLYTARFWGNPDYRDCDSWYFHDGIIACKLTSYKELTKEEYNLLTSYIY